MLAADSGSMTTIEMDWVRQPRCQSRNNIRRASPSIQIPYRKRLSEAEWHRSQSHSLLIPYPRKATEVSIDLNKNHIRATRVTGPICHRRSSCSSVRATPPSPATKTRASKRSVTISMSTRAMRCQGAGPQGLPVEPVTTK